MIEVVAETGSTNADLAARLARGHRLAEGDWLVADRQLAGKGRLGRVWNDGAGNFMGSTIVVPNRSDPSPATLALVTGVAVHSAVAAFAQERDLVLKWPNDLLLEGSKVAGILLEMVGGTVVVGVGVNLVHAPSVEGRTIASLSDIGLAPQRDHFAAEMVSQFEAELRRWREAGLSPLLRRWQAVAHAVGTRLRVAAPGEEAVDGAFAGLASDGNLRLALEDGTVRTIHAGDVLLV